MMNSNFTSKTILLNSFLRGDAGVRPFYGKTMDFITIGCLKIANLLQNMVGYKSYRAKRSNFLAFDQDRHLIKSP